MCTPYAISYAGCNVLSALWESKKSAPDGKQAYAIVLTAAKKLLTFFFFSWNLLEFQEKNFSGQLS